MPNWLQRYKAGECAAVWSEMQALGPAIRTPAHRKPGEAVVRETMKRARSNVVCLVKELPALGYRFRGLPEPSETDYPLRLRLDRALAYVKEHGPSKYRANPWSHPALAWVEEEEIDVPTRFLKGQPGRAYYRPPCPRILRVLTEIEQQCGSPLPLAVRAWFETVGSVNLKGAHPSLNPGGSIAVLRVRLEEIDGHAQPDAGADFVAAMRHAFEWGGFPGWSGRHDVPERELAWLRAKLLPV